MRGRSFRACLIAPAVLSLGGCASFIETVGRSQDTRTLNPDSVQGPRGTARAAEANAPGAPKKTNGSSPTEAAADRLRGPVDCQDKKSFKFMCVQSSSEADPLEPEPARTYLLAGLTLSNELCDTWFNQLQIAQVTLRQSSDTISNVGSLTAAILGFTRTPSATIGLTASLFGAGKQATDTLANNYIVATDLTAVAAAVREYRALYARDIENAPGSWNYYTARRVIMAYDNTCSALFVKKFVNTRVAGSAGNSAEPLYDAAIGAFAGEWTKYFTKETTAADLVDIYAYQFLLDAPKPVRDVLAKSLTSKGLADANGIVFAKDVNGNTLISAISRANIDAVLKSRAQTRVDTIRAQLTAEAATTAKAAGETAAAAGRATSDAAAARQAQQSAKKTVDDLQQVIDQKTQQRLEAQEQAAAYFEAKTRETELKAKIEAPLDATLAATEAAAAREQQARDLVAVQKVMTTATAASARVDTLTKDLAGLSTQIDQAKKDLAAREKDAAAAQSRATTASEDARNAQSAAENAQKAATTATGTPGATDAMIASAAPAPVGRNNKPLDSPPPP